MKDIKINLNSPEEIYDCGRCFESNAAEIQIVLTEDIYTSSEYFTLDFKNSVGDTFISERIEKNSVTNIDEENIIIYKIPKSITQFGNVKCVVTGYREENENIVMVCKSPIFDMRFEESINGEEYIEDSVFGIEAEMTKCLLKMTKCLEEMKKKTKTVYCEDLLASGTFNSTSSSIDTGITINQLRQYKHIFFNITGGSARNTITLNLGYSDPNYSSTGYGIINPSSVSNANILLSWIDTDKKYYTGKMENNSSISCDDWTSYPGLCYSMAFLGTSSTNYNSSFGNAQIGSIELKEVDTGIATPLDYNCTLVWNSIICPDNCTWKMYGVMKDEVIQDD